MNNDCCEMDEWNEEACEDLPEGEDLVLALGRFLEAHEPDHVIFNPVQCRKMLAARLVLKRMLEEHLEEGPILCNISTLTRQGFLTVELISFECEDMPDFMTLIRDAETFEFYPKTNGTMQFSLGFSQVVIGYREEG